MAEQALAAWPGEEWLDFVMGVRAAAGRVDTLYTTLVDHAPPLPDPPPAGAAVEEQLDALLGLEVLSRRLADLLDRAAAAAPLPAPGRPSDGDLLR